MTLIYRCRRSVRVGVGVTVGITMKTVRVRVMVFDRANLALSSRNTHTYASYACPTPCHALWAIMGYT